MRLFKRGRYWHVEIDRDNRRSLRTGDEREARRIYREIKRQHLANRLLRLDRDKNITLKQFTEEYLDYRLGCVASNTWKSDQRALKYLQDVIGSPPLPLINIKRIDEFKQACLLRGVKPKSVNSYLRHLKSALSKACEWGMIEAAPKIKLLPENKDLPKYLKPAEIETLLKKARKSNPTLHRLLLFYLWTGCRRREALQVTWPDCFLDSPRPRVIFRGTKGRVDRVVPLLPVVVEALLPIKKDLGNVFPRVHPDTVTHWFQTLAKDCGVKARLHDLRHTAATFMIASGINPRIVQEILGHAQFSTTEIYTHLVQESLYSEMEKLTFE